MKTKVLSIAAFILFAIGVSAQDTLTAKQQVNKDAKVVGNGVKDGANWTAKTAVKGYDATKEGAQKGAKWTKKAAKKTGKWTKKAAVNTKDATVKGYNDTKDYVKKETK